MEPKFRHNAANLLTADFEFVGSFDNGGYEPRLEAFIKQGRKPIWDAPSPQKALAAIDGFRVLIAHNSGSSRTLQINHLCEKILRSQRKDDINRPVFKT